MMAGIVFGTFQQLKQQMYKPQLTYAIESCANIRIF
jgi:hypothetical protein